MRLKRWLMGILFFVSFLCYAYASERLVMKLTGFSEEGVTCWILFTLAYSIALGLVALTIKE